MSKNWKSLSISGRLMVSDFQRIHCTDSHYVKYTPDQLGEPGQVLADFEGYYYTVYLDHYEGDDVFIRMNDKVYKVKPRLKIRLEQPLSYAWGETEVFVEPLEKTRKEILDDPNSTEEQKSEVIDWCLEHLEEVDSILLEQVADLLYFPKNRILDLEGAKRCYLELAQRPGCPPGYIYRFYSRAARICYLALNPAEGDIYVEKAMEPKVYGGDIAPRMWKIDYEWHTTDPDCYSSLYRYGKLPVIKEQVDARQPLAMAYLLDRIVPLEDEGMRCIAELCETCLMEEFRKSGERDYDAIAPVAFYKFAECDDMYDFKNTWPYKQLEKGVSRGCVRSMYYYAFIEELLGWTVEEDQPDVAAQHFEKAIHYYRRCVDCLDRQAMVGVVSLMCEKDPDNEELPFLIKCLRAFTYKDQKFKFLGDIDPDEPGSSDDGSGSGGSCSGDSCSGDDDFDDDDYPDDDGRFDPWA